MKKSSSRVALFSLALVACKPCEDDCEEFVELAFVSQDPTGMFGSTRYDVVANAGVESASCSFDVDGRSADCNGDAEGRVDLGDGSGEDTTGGFEDGRVRLIMRWKLAPEMLDVTVRDAAQTLVLSNTLTPAYQDQGVSSCDGQCRSFDRELMLPTM